MMATKRHELFQLFSLTQTHSFIQTEKRALFMKQKLNKCINCIYIYIYISAVKISALTQAINFFSLTR